MGELLAVASALSGLGTGVGVACLYWSMNQGPMSVVVPVSDVTAVGLPVPAGITLLGDRPSPPALTFTGPAPVAGRWCRGCP